MARIRQPSRVKSLDVIDLLLPSLVQQMNSPGLAYDANDATLVAGISDALRIDRAAVWARLSTYCHRSVTVH